MTLSYKRNQHSWILLVLESEITDSRIQTSNIQDEPQAPCSARKKDSHQKQKDRSMSKGYRAN